MLPALNEITPSYRRYSITSRWTQFEGDVILQYGIEQITLDGNGNTVKTALHNITDDRQIIKDLLRLVENEDVPATSLHEVVEDFIAENYTVAN